MGASAHPGWPTKVDPEPDPFTEEEQDLLIDYFTNRNQHYLALVVTMFRTGLRTGEACGLRWGDIDLRGRKLTVRRSRTMGEDNPPKTRKSRRTITLLENVVAMLRRVQPLHAGPDTFVFATQQGTPLDGERFVEKHWRRALRATGVRPRKFYATRHTFISLALTWGLNLKWLADYCGTSVEMIERHYGRFMNADSGQLAILAGRGGSGGPSGERQPMAATAGRSTRPARDSALKTGTFAGTFRKPRVTSRSTKAEGGRFELPYQKMPRRAGNAGNRCAAWVSCIAKPLAERGRKRPFLT